LNSKVSLDIPFILRSVRLAEIVNNLINSDLLRGKDQAVIYINEYYTIVA